MLVHSAGRAVDMVEKMCDLLDIFPSEQSNVRSCCQYTLPFALGLSGPDSIVAKRMWVDNGAPLVGDAVNIYHWR
jgi:hypothetical protein